MKDTIFREYDIRGKVGSELVVGEVYDLTRAIAYYFKEIDSEVKTIAVGMDGRLHSPTIKDEICRALTDSGLDVVYIGVCPTPVLYFALYTMPVDGGLMVTASHNTKEYNGIKMCLAKSAVWGEQIKKIRDLYKEKKHIQTMHKGTLREQSIIDTYIDWLVNHFKELKGYDISAVVDCGNGAAGTVMPQLIKAMEFKNVQLLYPEVDGTYPHHEADPTIPENMEDVKQLLAHTNLELGIGLDGDCDRMAAMTKEGELITGDKLLALFAHDVLRQHPGAAIVFDIKSSSGLMELLKKWGAKPVMSATGHTNIKNQMKEHKALLGGELSCHFFFNDDYFGYDDGIYAMLRLFKILKQSGKSLHELLQIFPNKYSSPEIRMACSDEKKHAIVAYVKQVFAHRTDVEMITLDGIRVNMPYGWGIVRASNTQPALSIRFEADSPEDLQKIKKEFIDVLKKYFDIALLKQEFGA
jgi:phosphomannomutase / phosphoglucomutase